MQPEARGHQALVAPSQHVVDRADRVPGLVDSAREAEEEARLGRAGRQQVDGVNRPLLADAIDAADALLQAHRVPGQFEIDDEPAATLEVQAFASRVGRQQTRAHRRR